MAQPPVQFLIHCSTIEYLFLYYLQNIFSSHGWTSDGNPATCTELVESPNESASCPVILTYALPRAPQMWLIKKKKEKKNSKEKEQQQRKKDCVVWSSVPKGVIISMAIIWGYPP